MFGKILSPAISIMNRLPFKLKIILSVSMLFLLLILPSYTIISNYIQKKNLYNMQLIGSSYGKLTHSLIRAVQTHRGATSSYLNSDTAFRDTVKSSQKKIDEKVLKLLEFDSKHLAILENNENFTSALNKLKLVSLESIMLTQDIDQNFEIHTNIISSITNTLDEISAETHLMDSENRKLNYLALTLQEKLPLIEESIGQLKELTIGALIRGKVSQKEREEILYLYTLIRALEEDMLSNRILKKLTNYDQIYQATALASAKLDKVLYIAKQDIIILEMPVYNSKAFFAQTTKAMDAYDKLYKILTLSYNELTMDLKERLYVDFILTTVSFFAILSFALYIFTAFFISIKTSLKKLQYASEMISKDKTAIQLEVDTQDEIGSAILAFNDMSKKLNENISFLDSYKVAIDESSLVSKTDLEGVITYANRLFCDVSGYSKDELIGMPHKIVRHPDMPKEVFRDLWETIKAKKVWHGIVKNRAKNGGFYIADTAIVPILNSDRDIVEYISIRHDITELEKSKEEIKKQKVDFLTDLPNRNQLLEDLKTLQTPTLLYLNIDDFTGLNDFYGTKVGDIVLKHIAKLLDKTSKNICSKLYKLNTDEFLLLFKEGVLTKISSQEIMNNVIDSIECEKIEFSPKNFISITLCGGISFYRADQDHKDLLTYAVLARKMAKHSNKKFLLYDSKTRLYLNYKSNIECINRIKKAIVENRIVVYFQPIIDNKTNTATKYESLVRMIGENGEAISPFFFLDIAKKANIYTEITKIVVDKTLETYKRLPQYSFSINITVEDINSKEISSYLLNKLDTLSRPENLIFEITESEEIKDYLAIGEFTKNIKKHGVKIAIDDFGSGYANFEHIIALNADFIKIDGSLIKNIDKDENSRIITEAIIAFSKKLGSKTIAEYVHNEKIQEIVKSMGADFSQGFHLGKPSPDIA